jgi:hypothetical protein
MIAQDTMFGNEMASPLSGLSVENGHTLGHD